MKKTRSTGQPGTPEQAWPGHWAGAGGLAAGDGLASAWWAVAAASLAG